MTRTNVWNRWRRRPATPQRPFLPSIESLEDRAVPSTFTVRNLADGGSGSLRQAVLDANAAKGADDIAFEPGLHGTITLKSSHFLRVVLKTIAPAMPELEKEASRLGKLKRPSNAREKAAEREEYEQTLATAVIEALRTCSPPKASGAAPPEGKGLKSAST